MAIELKPGDKVNVRLKDRKFVSAYSESDEELTFEIVAVDDKGYFVYVPEYLNLSGSILVNSYNIKSLKINKKFLNSSIIYISSHKVAKVAARLDGCICCKCEEFFNYAVPNQSNGTLICYSCRNYPRYNSVADEED